MIKHFLIFFFPSLLILSLLVFDDSFAKNESPEIEKFTFIDNSSPAHFGKQCDDEVVTEKFTYFKKNIKWKTLPVKYSFHSSVPNEIAKLEISKAFDTWNNLYGATFFTEKISPNIIRFSPIDGEGNIVAVTTMYYSPQDKEFTKFVITFDSDETWGVGPVELIGVDGAGFFDYQDVASHEVGHVVGLGHVTSPKDCMLTMFKFIEEGETIKRTIDNGSGDKLGFEELYGIS
ncbi:MAG: matrixin family metalloprotease [Nitrosopumilaceae archaeon]|jgi:hypothetical protein